MDKNTAKEMDRFLDSAWAMAFDIRIKVRAGAITAALAFLATTAAVIIVVCCDMMPAAQMESLSMTAYIVTAILWIVLLAILAVLERTSRMICSNLRTMIFRAWSEAESDEHPRYSDTL